MPLNVQINIYWTLEMTKHVQIGLGRVTMWPRLDNGNIKTGGSRFRQFEPYVRSF